MYIFLKWDSKKIDYCSMYFYNYYFSFQLTFWVWCPESRPKIGLSAFPIITLTVTIQPPVWPRPQQRRQMHYLQPIKFTDNYYTNYKKDLSQSINVFYEKFWSVLVCSIIRPCNWVAICELDRIIWQTICIF